MKDKVKGKREDSSLAFGETKQGADLSKRVGREISQLGSTGEKSEKVRGTFLSRRRGKREGKRVCLVSSFWEQTNRNRLAKEKKKKKRRNYVLRYI